MEASKDYSVIALSHEEADKLDPLRLYGQVRRKRQGAYLYLDSEQANTEFVQAVKEILEG